MEFDIIDGAIGVCAKRGSGKSQLVKYLLHNYYKKFDKIIIISATEKINQFYQRMPFIDPKFIYDKYDESFIKALMKSMAQVNKGLLKGNPKMKHVLLILDDICSSFNTHSSKTLEELFTTGRHYGLAVVIVQQYINSIPPVVRTNCDYICVSQMNKQGLDLLAQQYLFGNIEEKDFKKLYLQSTSDYGFMIINSKCAKSNDNLNEIYGVIRVPASFIKN
jgi:ABC-type dipeptide/oligopeptide/nickel transport system ATPase subunit